jgi:hypothetical protein
LKNPKFIYFTGNPKSIADEAERLVISQQNFKDGKVYDYTITDKS